MKNPDDIIKEELKKNKARQEILTKQINDCERKSNYFTSDKKIFETLIKLASQPRL